MGDATLSKSEWIVAQWVKYLGVPGLAGLVLIVLASAVLLGFILPAEAKSKRVASAAVDLQNPRNLELSNTVTRALPVESGLDSFYKSLPPEQSAVNVLDKIYKSASNESLRLTQGEYKFTRDKAGRFGNYQITLPVRGSYVQVRKFIAKVLNGVPTASLDGVSFKRETIGGTDLEAKIQFSVFLGIV
jgi:Tfp pilus assembly protein PilO